MAILNNIFIKLESLLTAMTCDADEEVCQLEVNNVFLRFCIPWNPLPHHS